MIHASIHDHFTLPDDCIRWWSLSTEKWRALHFCLSSMRKISPPFPIFPQFSTNIAGMGTFHHSSLIVISSYINGIQPTSIWNHFIHSFLPLSFTTSPYLSPVAFLPFPIIFGISHYTHSSFPHLSSPTVFPIFLHFTNLLFIKKKQSVGALLSLFFLLDRQSFQGTGG